MTGPFKDDQKHGIWKFYYKDGKLGAKEASSMGRLMGSGRTTGKKTVHSGRSVTMQME